MVVLIVTFICYSICSLAKKHNWKKIFSTWQNRLYVILCACRVMAALACTGYVHPDEYFQSFEIAAADICSLPKNQTLVPWEFKEPNPIRSVFSVGLVSHLPMLLVCKFPFEWFTTSRAILCVQRLWMCCLSFIVDAMAAISADYLKIERSGPLLCIAGSWVTLVMLVRPFSNSGETIFLSLALARIFHLCGQSSFSCASQSGHHIASNDTCHEKREGLQIINFRCVFAIGFLLCIGVFIRFTMIILAVPLIFFLASRKILHYKQQTSSAINSDTIQSKIQCEKSETGGRHKFGLLKDLISFSGALATGATFAALIGVMTDSLYYKYVRGHDSSQWYALSDLKILQPTPLSAALYNTVVDNLALHGLHPHWTHAVINAPLMFSIMYIVALYRAFVGIASLNVCSNKKRSHQSFPTDGVSSLEWCLLCCTFFYLLTLSLARHQEPRFLGPLLVPFALLAGPTFLRSRLLLVAWISCNFFLTIVYGVFHQAGVPLAISLVANDISTVYQHDINYHEESFTSTTVAQTYKDDICVTFVGTYMPPRALLLLGLPRQLRPRVKIMSVDASENATETLSKMFIEGEAPLSKCDAVYFIATQKTLQTVHYTQKSKQLPFIPWFTSKNGHLVGTAAHFSGEEPLEFEKLLQNLHILRFNTSAVMEKYCREPE